MWALLLACVATERVGPPPIVLVSIDTFRADRLGALGNADGLTPNLDALAAESVLFEDTYSQAVQTAPSHTSLFTSRYPGENVLGDGRPGLPDEAPTLAEVLGTYGYDTAAFVAGGDLRRHRGLDRGFDTYAEAKDFSSLWHTGPAALDWLDTRADTGAPWFLFVHGYDTHSPYPKPPPFGFAHADARDVRPGMTAARSDPGRVLDGVMYSGFLSLVAAYERDVHPRSPAGRARMHAQASASDPAAVPLDDADLALIRHVYDGAVSYADTQLGLFLAGLASRGVLDEAVVVVLSDHGEGLGEHGLFGHCCEANDEETHVPLLVRLPKGEGGGRRVRGLVELADVMPTLLELAGAQSPAGARGRSLTGALRGEPFVGREIAFTEGTERMRMVSARAPGGRLTWVGLTPTSPLIAPVLDAAWIDGPGFTATGDLAPEAREGLRDALVGILRERRPARGNQRSAQIPDDLKASLRAHGYWDPQ